MIVKEGKFAIGHYALTKSKIPQDIGSEFICLLLSWRPKAMIYKPNVKAYYDPTTKAFRDTEKAAKLPNSNRGFGPEFLMWLPDYEEVATFFMGNASGRMEGPNVVNCLDKGSRICKIGNILVTSKKNGNMWHAPRFLQHDLSINMPDLALIMPIVERFNNPPVEEEAEAPEDSRG